MDRKISPFLLGRIILLVALTLSACSPSPAPTTPAGTVAPPTTVAPSITPPQTSVVPTTAIPTDTPTPTPQAAPQITQPVVENPNFGLDCVANEMFDFSQVLDTTPFYIQGQVILTGPAEEFSGTLDRLAAAGIYLTPVILCTLSIPISIPNPNPNGKPYQKEPTLEGRNASFPFMGTDPSQPAVAGNRLAIDLYQLKDSSIPFLIFLDQLNKVQSNQSKQGRIYADPNYLIGHLAKTACGNPPGVEGNPFGVEGSPFGVEGSPYGGMGLDANPSGFWKQWAFQQVGLTQPGDGNDVRVGVFDTSPFPVPPGITTTFPVTITDIDPQLNMTVHSRLPLSSLSATTPVTAQVNVEDHGLFVASLIHAFASQSQIDLYQVLDNAGCGDLYRLNIAILDFLSADWGPDGLIQHAVINLSLGVRKPRNSPPEPTASAIAATEINQMGVEIQQAYGPANNDPSIESLETVVQLASQAGMVIVAAAGNDSVYDSPPLPNMPLPMELPAGYSFVIGVSASTIKNEPACYSNSGDVAAPGGDGVMDNSSPGNPTCLPNAFVCPTQDANAGTPGACEFGVMGLSTISPSYYAYWVGTSFATPMVSGLAALVYQQTRFPGETARRIEQNPLINVQDALRP